MSYWTAQIWQRTDKNFDSKSREENWIRMTKAIKRFFESRKY